MHLAFYDAISFAVFSISNSQRPAGQPEHRSRRSPAAFLHRLQCRLCHKPKRIRRLQHLPWRPGGDEIFNFLTFSLKIHCINFLDSQLSELLVIYSIKTELSLFDWFVFRRSRLLTNSKNFHPFSNQSRRL